MSTDGLLKGAVAGAGAALLVMYFAKRSQSSSSAGKLSQASDNSSVLKDMSDEKLAELKDNIEDIMAEREV